jgi:hypothetical protein
LRRRNSAFCFSHIVLNANAWQVGWQWLTACRASPFLLGIARLRFLLSQALFGDNTQFRFVKQLMLVLRFL